MVADEWGRSALGTIRAACFERFEGGRLGVANGLRRDGTPLDPTDGLLPYRLMGETGLALAITGAVVEKVYAAVGTFRACQYLRAMAIWPRTPAGSGFPGQRAAALACG